MSLLPSVPKVELRIPAVIFAGQPTSFELDVIAKEAVKIDFVRVRVCAIQGWSIGSGKNQISHEITYPELAIDLAGPGTLDAGTYTRGATFTLPPDVAPTHAAYPAHGRVELRVHISIPWWPDGRYRYDLPVRLPAHGELARRPVLARSTEQPNKPRMELSLASNRLIAGETVVGSCALFHIDDKKPRDVEVSLVPELELYGRGRARERTGTPVRLSYEMPAGSAGQDVRFRMQLPANLTPSFRSRTHKLSWYLVAKTGSFFGPSVQVIIPLEIFDRSAAARSATLTVAPRVADEKIAQTFAAFAERDGWTLIDPARTRDDESPAITKTVKDHAITLAYAYRGKEGTALVARVQYPSLGLDLAVVPGSTLRHAFFHDIEIDDAAWDRAHHVTARNAAQAVPFLKRLVPELQGFEKRGIAKLVRIDDDAIVYERAIGALEDGHLVAFGQSLPAVSLAAADARAAIPPPPDVAVDVEAWQRLATALDGELVVGELAIDGTLDGVAASVSLVWDGEGKPRAIAAHVGDAAHASELVRRVAFSAQNPTTPGVGDGLPDGIAARLATWPLDVANLDVHDGVASAELALAAPPATDAPPVADAARAHDLVRALRTLLAALDPGSGPYR